LIPRPARKCANSSNVQTKAQVKDSQRSLIAEDELDQKFIVTEEQLELRRELRDKFDGEDVLLSTIRATFAKI